MSHMASPVNQVMLSSFLPVFKDLNIALESLSSSILLFFCNLGNQKYATCTGPNIILFIVFVVDILQGSNCLMFIQLDTN